MRTPWYEPSPGALLAFLNANRQAIPHDLFTFRMASGAVLRYTSLDAGVTIAGNTWLPGPAIKRTRISRKVGLEVATMNVDLAANETVLAGGVPIVGAFASGAFSGTTVRLDRAFMNDSAVVQGALGLFFGRIGAVRTELGRAKFEVRSHNELLDVMVPADVYQPGCRNTLWDLRCGLARATYKSSGAVSVASGPAKNSFGCATFGKAADWFSLGTVTFKTGANAGLSRTVRLVSTAGGVDTFQLVSPLPYAVAAGDTFDAYPGCDKTKPTCGTKFNNLARFRAEPYIPAPETVT